MRNEDLLEMITKILSSPGQHLPKGLCKRCQATMKQLVDYAVTELGLTLYASKVETDGGHVVGCVWKSISKSAFCRDLPLDVNVPVVEAEDGLVEGDLVKDLLPGDLRTASPFGHEDILPEDWP